MKKSESMFVGCDLGDRYSQLCVLDTAGQVVERDRVGTTRTELTAWFQHRERLRVVIEVGVHSRWVNDVLTKLGHEVIIANARNVQLLTRSQKKTDKNDAELLARLGRADVKLLAPVRHRSIAAHADLVCIRTRDVLVRERTRLVNHARGVAKSFGVRLPRCYPEAFVKKTRLLVPDAIAAAMEPVFRCIDGINMEIKQLDRHLAARAAKAYPETAKLDQVAGVGPITSLAFLLTIEDPSRFRKSRMVGAYLGLAAGKSQSGDRDPEKRITKAGDRLVRRLLVNCAQYILARGPDSDLKRWGLNLVARGKKNAKKRAIVATARKLAVLLHRLWVTDEPYEPLRMAKQLAA
jgi:transposase